MSPYLIWGSLCLHSFFNLVFTGWAISQFVTGILIRYGLGAESLTWVLPFMIAPVSCIYYPLSTLPWLQEVASVIPTSYVFEGMRALLLDGQWRADLFPLNALSLNLIYFLLGMVSFLLSFSSARKHGLLLQSGE